MLFVEEHSEKTCEDNHKGLQLYDQSFLMDNKENGTHWELDMAQKA